MASTNRIIIMLILFILLVLFSPIIKHYVRMLYATEGFKGSQWCNRDADCGKYKRCRNNKCT